VRCCHHGAITIVTVVDAHVSLQDTATPEGFAPIDRPSEQVSRRETWAKVLAALGRFPEPARTILKKRMIEGSSFDAIAKLLKKPLDTVKTIYYRGAETLRKRMELPAS